jgi:carnosine N-methyltransferase
MVKVRSTLKQCVRDWSDVGKPERDSCYGPLVQALQEHLPVASDNFGTQKVLVPGSGLGRLVFDLAVMGYDAQGNEFSYFMLLMGDYIMNHSSSARCHTVYPWLGESCNMMSREEEFQGIAFPDIYPNEAVQNAPGQVNMSVAAGEFLQCYDNEKNYGTWDGVATCFFIDTAPNVIEYVEAISKMLKTGGIWTNVGPLEYHWKTFRDNDIYERDPRYLESIELAYADIKRIILSYGFEYLHEERKECFYSSRSSAMKKTLFDCVHFTVRKK